MDNCHFESFVVAMRQAFTVILDDIATFTLNRGLKSHRAPFSEGSELVGQN